MQTLLHDIIAVLVFPALLVGVNNVILISNAIGRQETC